MPSDRDAGRVTTELRGEVAIVTLDRPSVRNAFTPALLEDLCAAITRVEREPGIEGLVLRGAGGAFCAGADIRWEREATASEFRRFVGRVQDLTRQLHASDLIVVAAIDGPALGGGSELALACDYRVANPSAVLGFPEVKLGLHVTGGVTHVLPRLVGPSRALELLVSGRSVPAAEALAIGLVDRVADDALALAVEVASVRNSAPPGLAALIKASLHAGAEGSLDGALRMEREAIMEAFMRPEAREGMTAFLEKRAPSYRQADAASAEDPPTDRESRPT